MTDLDRLAPEHPEMKAPARRQWPRVAVVVLLAVGAALVGLKVFGDDSPSGTVRRPAMTGHEPTSPSSQAPAAATASGDAGRPGSPNVPAGSNPAGLNPPLGASAAPTSPSPTIPSGLGAEPTTTMARRASGIDGGARSGN